MKEIIKSDVKDDYILTTSIVTGKYWIYETSISHKNFNNFKEITLRGCMYKKDAIAMHEKLVNKLKKGVLRLTDIYTGCVYVKDSMSTKERLFYEKVLQYEKIIMEKVDSVWMPY